jgi:hypothetical protein
VIDYLKMSTCLTSVLYGRLSVRFSNTSYLSSSSFSLFGCFCLENSVIMKKAGSTKTAKEIFLAKIHEDRKLLLEWIKLSTDDAYLGGWLQIPDISKPFWTYGMHILKGNGQISIT